MRPTSFFRAAALAAALAGAACDSPTAPEPVAELDLSPMPMMLAVGDSVQLEAVLRSATGRILGGRRVVWTSSDTDVAIVTGAGLVRAVGEGEATLSAESEGVSEGFLTQVVAEPAVSLDLDAALDFAEGSLAAVNATLRTAQGEVIVGANVEWLSRDPAVATVDQAGNVQTISEGFTWIVARYGALRDSTTVSVRPAFGGTLLLDGRDALDSRTRVHRLAPKAWAEEAQALLPADSWGASASPDGQRVAFACDAAAPAICVADRSGGDLRVLTGGDDFHEAEPAWSRDGSRIAFVRWAAGAAPGTANPTDIWTMDVDGGDQANLTADAAVQWAPAWEPALGAGARIAFAEESPVDGAPAARIASIRADGTGRRFETAQGAWMDASPAWSPDGSRLAFVRTGGAIAEDLFVVERATGIAQPLLAQELTGAQGRPSWSPNGRHIAFISAHAPEIAPGGTPVFLRQVYTVRADGTGVRRRSFGGGHKDHPEWTVAP